MSGDINKHFKDLHNSVNQCFTNEQCIMIQNHTWIIDPFKVQDKATHFNVAEYKFIDMVLDSICLVLVDYQRRLFTRRLLNMYWNIYWIYSIYWTYIEKAVKIFQLHIHVRPDFLHPNVNYNIEFRSKFKNLDIKPDIKEI